jgi:hypothetical protein
MNWRIVAFVFSTCFGGLMLAQTGSPAKHNIGSMGSARSLSGQMPPSYECGGIGATRSFKGIIVSELALVPQDACSDPIDKCNNPVKYLGSNGDCACFACEYRKASQHNICTKSESDKRTLLQRAGTQ